jgi:hypothetical protein
VVNRKRFFKGEEREVMNKSWECLLDESYYDMWLVRPTDNKTWGVGFHLSNQDEARALCDLLNERYQSAYEAGFNAGRNSKPSLGTGVGKLDRRIAAANHARFAQSEIQSRTLPEPKMGKREV